MAKNADNKSWLSTLFTQNASEGKEQFGVNLTTNNKAFSGELSNFGQQFVNTNKKYQNEMAKYKRIAEFNKQLTTAYTKNLRVMVDISKLLTDYSAFFHVLKEEIGKTEGQIGTLQASEVQHIENLTKEKLGEFGTIFQDQTEKVKALYAKYGQEDARNKVTELQESLNNVTTNAANTYKFIANAKGGRPKKALKKKTLK
jgi:hypothetical protein